MHAYVNKEGKKVILITAELIQKNKWIFMKVMMTQIMKSYTKWKRVKERDISVKGSFERVDLTFS